MLSQKNLVEYISEELAVCEFYRRLSGMTDCPDAKKSLMEMSENEAEHAKMLQMLHKEMFGEMREPVHFNAPMPAGFKKALCDAVDGEALTYRKYANIPLNIKDARVQYLFAKLSLDENVHAHTLSKILHGMADEAVYASQNEQNDLKMAANAIWGLQNEQYDLKILDGAVDFVDPAILDSVTPAAPAAVIPAAPAPDDMLNYMHELHKHMRELQGFDIKFEI